MLDKPLSILYISVVEKDNTNYGQLPLLLKTYPITVTESMYYLYMPIKMADSDEIRMPKRLWQFNRLLNSIRILGTGADRHTDILKGKYLYISAKHMLVNPGFWGGRGGYHCEGFMSDDTNWLWYDENPPTFNSTKFDITPDPIFSLAEFEQQADYRNEVKYPEFSLLELNPYTVHKITPVTRYFQSTVVKFTLSKNKYNLIGNTHNYDINYDWEMYPRNPTRNYPVYTELEEANHSMLEIG